MTLYPEETKAFKSKSGSLYATPAQAIRADYADKIDKSLLAKHPEAHMHINFIWGNLELLAELLCDYPLKKDAP